MSQLTKLQHFVPRFYLKHWCDSKGAFRCHDLNERRDFPANPDGVLAQKYFYEEDRAAPDNRVENILKTMEGTLSITFKKLAAVGKAVSGDTNRQKAATTVKAGITVDDQKSIKDFAALQYMRVPGAIKQKSLELEPSDVSPEERRLGLNPGRFVENGYLYVKDCFSTLKLHIFLSPSREFITSDWPCFDLKDSNDTPLLGEEIGRNPEVLCYLPLTPSGIPSFFYQRIQ